MTPSRRPTSAGAAVGFLTVAFLAGALASTGPAAAQEPIRAAVAGPAPAGVPHVQPAAEREEDAACTRARRRFWIEGEGWVVRRVTTCR